MTRVLGLTGGIGTGKSTVARMFAELGAVVLDADAIVHELQAPGQPMLDAIAEAFGPELIDADGALDREALGERVFSDEDARKRLNAIVHPAVGAEMARRLAAAREAGVPLVLLDIPLLLETRSKGGSGAMVEAVIVVYAPPEAQIERQRIRDGRDREAALERMRAQLPIDEKREMADHVIDNSGSLEETEAQVRAVFAELSGAAG
ncbi:MAG: dephospho-CoA kinase [Myxococcota bacterium]|nr:dephospho-CoA kinase [Myxococcota bacterium]